MCVCVCVLFSITDLPEFTTLPLSQTKKEGEHVTFSCDANSGNPVPTTFSWTLDGIAVTSTARISLSPDNKQLNITNVNRTDSGQYRCLAVNDAGTATSSAATLDVQCKYI